MKTLFSALFCHTHRIWLWHISRLIRERITQRFHQIRVCCVTAPIWFCSAAVCVVKTTTQSVPDRSLIAASCSGIHQNKSPVYLLWTAGALRSRYTAQQTWWKLRHYLKWKTSSAPPHSGHLSGSFRQNWKWNLVLLRSEIFFETQGAT